MRKPTLLTLFLIVLIDLVGFGLIMPLLPYFGRQFGATGVEIGWLFGIFSAMQFLFSPIWGRLSDRMGRRPILLISLGGATFSYLLLAASTNYGAALASRALAGICAANIAVANAYVADITTKENRSRGMGLIGAAFGIGFILGPVLAGFFGSGGHRLPCLIAAGVSAISLLLAFFFLPESLTTPSTDRSSLWNDQLRDWGNVLGLPRIGALVVVFFLANLALSKWETTFALFVHDDPFFGYGIETVGYLFAYVGLVVALCQGGLLGRLVKLFGEPVLLKAGLIALSAGLFFTPFCRTLPQIVVCLTAVGAGLGMIRPVLFGVASILTSPDRQGLILGVLQGAGSLGRIGGPLMGGWLLDRNVGFPFWAGSIILLMALALTPPARYIREAKGAD